MPPASHRQLIDELRRKMHLQEQIQRTAAVAESLRVSHAELSVAQGSSASHVSTGIAALDRLLPEHGLRRGELVEWLAEQGGGAETLALYTARAALQTVGGMLAVIDDGGDFYAPAAALRGIDLSRLILVRPATRGDKLWACDQALRCPGVSVVLCGGDRLDDRTFRRLQLAVEGSGGVGILLRSAKSQGEPTWAGVRFFVESRIAPIASHGRWLEVRVERCRGGFEQRAVTLEIDDETGDVRVVSELAPATAVRRPPRAQDQRCSHGAVSRPGGERSACVELLAERDFVGGAPDDAVG